MLHILLLLLFLQPSPGTPTRSPGAALSRVASTGQSPSTVRPVGPGPPPPRELSSTTGPEEGLGETSSLCGLLLAFRHLRGRGVTQAGVMRPSKQDVGWEGGREPLGPQECGRRCRSIGIQGKSPVMGDWGPGDLSAMGSTAGGHGAPSSSLKGCPTSSCTYSSFGALQLCRGVEPSLSRVPFVSGCTSAVTTSAML